MKKLLFTLLITASAFAEFRLKPFRQTDEKLNTLIMQLNQFNSKLLEVTEDLCKNPERAKQNGNDCMRVIEEFVENYKTNEFTPSVLYDLSKIQYTGTNHEIKDSFNIISAIIQKYFNTKIDCEESYDHLITVQGAFKAGSNPTIAVYSPSMNLTTFPNLNMK